MATHLKDGKRKQFNTKLAPHVRDALQAAADASGRSLSHEVEYRLERSLLGDEVVSAVRDAVREEMRPPWLKSVA